MGPTNDYIVDTADHAEQREWG